MRAAVLLALIAGAIVAVIVGGSSGCLRSTQFECSSNVDCTRAGAQGTCEAVGFCSFGDPSCDSGRRYGSLSGPFADQCIPPPDAAVPDAPIDAAIDAYVHDARECFGGGAYMLCFAGMPPMGPVTLAGAFDTDTDTRCAPTMPQSWTDAGQPAGCLVMGKTITVTGTLTVTGARPLVLLGDAITIGGIIDVAAHRGITTPVPLSPAVQCAAFPTAPVGDIAGGGGGAGGSFMRAGGNGGRGNDNAALGGTAAAMDVVAPIVLRGGCPGQGGGTGQAASTIGDPGQGGGAVFITASNLTIANGAGINASGAGALGGTALAGGSGGGTGGMIVLHVAETITATGARLIANGGAGSAGSNAGTAGIVGADPAFTSPTTPAAGGTGPGGAGGNGFAGTNQAQGGNNAGGNRDTGGGGGGGAGYIQSNKPITGATVSPAPTIVP